MEEKFYSLDFYGKLDYVFSKCAEIVRSLESILNEKEAYLLIEESMDQLIVSFPVFALDEDFLNEDNFGSLFKRFRKAIDEIMELAPLVRSGDAYYGYMVSSLRDLCDIIELTLPNNLRLARFFIDLINNKEEIAKACHIDENELGNVLEKMLEKSNAVNDILANNTIVRGRK